MRIAMAQIDTVVGDVTANLKAVRDAIERAREAKADIVVFPEMTLTGYPLLDLVYRANLLERQRAALTEAARAATGIAAVVGFVDRDPMRRGTDGRAAVYNSAAVVKDGLILAVHRKNLLPEYDVFFERRYFVPGAGSTVVDVGGVNVGVQICEDLWDDNYESKVTRRECAAGADVVVNLSASPFHVGKGQERRELLHRHVRENGKPIVYVNQVGGEDGYEGELVFDGESLAVDGHGQLLAVGKQFEEDLVVFDLDPKSGRGKPITDRVADPDAEAFAALVRGVRDYGRRAGFKSALIGLSGGIDSALVAAIAQRAFGKENVLGIAMPSRFSSTHSLEDAKALAKNLGIEFRTISIEPVFESYLAQLAPSFAGKKPDVTEENLQARVRGGLLMALSNKTGAMVLSTGNKTEIALGYCTLYGDMCGGLTVLSDVSKERVYSISRYLNRASKTEVIPQRSIDKVPSAELREGQFDPFDYAIVSPLADMLVEEELEIDEAVAHGFDRALVERLAKMVKNAEYKRRQAAPGIKITSRAFGVGRRMPIAWPGE